MSRGRSFGDGRRIRRVFDMSVSEDVRREMEFHLQSKIDELVSEGWSAESAAVEAERRFGDVAAYAREMRSIESRQRRSAGRAMRLESLGRDVRVGARGLLRNPVFTVVAILTLALGIGANTAVFSVISATLLRPLPYPEPDRLVTIWEVNERGGAIHVADANFVDWQAGARSFEAMATYPSGQFGGPVAVLGGVEPVRRWASPVSADFFEVMRVEPAIGRVFEPEEALPSAARVVVVSDVFWREQLGANPDLSQASLRVGGNSYQVIGVMPPWFRFPGETDLWAPVPIEAGGYRTSHNWAVVARLRDGVPLESAQREMSAIAQRIRAEYGEEADAIDARVRPLHEELVGDVRRPLGLLLGAAALVLLVGCTNLASTLLARAGGRGREFAVRASLGAGRPRLVRQLLTESLLLSMAGAAAGLGVAAVAARTLLAIGPASVLTEPVGLDWRVLAFTLVIAVASAILFGLAPALRVSQADPGAALREGSRGTAGGRSSRLWGALIAVEVALAVILLICAGLILRSFQRVIAIDPGFDPRGVLTVELSVPSVLHPDDASLGTFHRNVLDRMGEVPGVASVGLVNHLPFGGVSINGGFEIEGVGESDSYAAYRVASDGYFAALGIPFIAGRDFDPLLDRSGSMPVVIVNEAFVRRFFPDGDALGRRIRNLANDSWVYGDEWLTVVGVVGNVRHRGPLSAADPETYVSVGQRPYRARDAFLLVKQREGGPPLAPILRDAIHSIDPNIPVEVSSMEARFTAAFAQRRFGMAVLAAFASLALLLAAVGIYGVVSYSVERRTREMGLRLALGAEPRAVMSRTMMRALLAVATGLVIGVPAALAATRLFQGLLYETPRADGLTLFAVAAVIAGVGVIASWVPARRLVRIDPAITLRTE